MLAEFDTESRDYSIYLEDADIPELLAGKTIESPLVIHRQDDIDMALIRVKIALNANGKISNHVLFDRDPITFTFSEDHFKGLILNDETYERNRGYSEIRYDMARNKINVFRGVWFYAENFERRARNRLANFDDYKRRYAELRAKKESD